METYYKQTIENKNKMIIKVYYQSYTNFNNVAVVFLINQISSHYIEIEGNIRIEEKPKYKTRTRR